MLATLLCFGGADSRSFPSLLIVPVRGLPVIDSACGDAECCIFPDPFLVSLIVFYEIELVLANGFCTECSSRVRARKGRGEHKPVERRRYGAGSSEEQSRGELLPSRDCSGK